VKIPAPVVAARKVVNAARKWAKSRSQYRKLLDSKSAKTNATETARRHHVEDTHTLEKAIIELEAAFKHYSLATPKGKKQAFPWKDVITVVARGAAVLDRALTPDNASPQQTARVIDTHGEPMPRRR
jgi:acyl-homoserine lactone acylase PvdQ